MISDARGGHVSPGIYTDEKEVVFSVQSLGITSLGVVGETLYGPAFENVEIKDWSEFVDYFGGTSPEKFKDTDMPKYELPYIAKSYLEQSKTLNVVRVLGLSGYDAGTVWTLSTSENGNPVVVLRSKMKYGEPNGENICTPTTDTPTAITTAITVTEYNPFIYTSECALKTGTSAVLTPGKLAKENSNPKFGLSVQTTNGTYQYNVSLNPYDNDYIYNVLSSDPSTGTTPIYIEAVYENAWDGSKISHIKESDNYRDFKEEYRPAQTPWIVSNVAATSGATTSATMHKLFKFVTISDGDAANFQVKVSIQNIKPSEGLFDVVVRDFNDDDSAPIVLEKFSKCSLVEGDSSYIAFKIGTTDGGFVSKSKYIAVEMADGEDLRHSIPAGFLGYPMPTYDRSKIDVNYYTKLNTAIKPKRQYFGLNSYVIDEDILKYKGRNYSSSEKLYENGETHVVVTNGFHMDSILTKYNTTNTYVDGESGYTFTTVSVDKVGSEAYIPRLIDAPYINQTIYADINNRKFTVYFYGGFDGWDINRESRTNTDGYKASRYNLSGSTAFKNASRLSVDLDLPNTAITTDYYAYLAGYRVFANPQDVEINVFATPGIDWYNNTLLTEDAIDVIQDKDDGRGGDAIYVMASPRDLPADELVEEFEASEIKSSYACTYYPWVMYYDKANKKYINLPVTKDVVRNMAETDNTSFPWFSPAGEKRGTVECIKAEHKTTLLEEDKLYSYCINPVKTFGKDGVFVWGNKTAYDVETPTNRVNVRRLMIRIKDLVTKASKGLIFDQYDDTLEKQFKGAIEPILAEVKAKRGLYDYRIKTEITEETRDQHILPAKILVKPTPALEYISISFVIYPESVEFDEN